MKRKDCQRYQRYGGGSNQLGREEPGRHMCSLQQQMAAVTERWGLGLAAEAEARRIERAETLGVNLRRSLVSPIAVFPADEWAGPKVFLSSSALSLPLTSFQVTPRSHAYVSKKHEGINKTPPIGIGTRWKLVFRRAGPRIRHCIDQHVNMLITRSSANHI